MKILFFTRLFYPHIGGVEKHVLEVGKILVKDGHSVTIVTENHGWKPQEFIEGMKVYRMSVGKDNWFKKFRIWWWLWKHRQLIQQTNIIHCHDVFFWYLPFRFLYPWKKVFTTFHGYEGFPISKKAIIIRKISEKLSKGNICIGNFITKWYGTKPSVVSVGAVDKEDFKKKNIKESDALFLGRLDDQTNILNYINAVKRIRRKLPKFSLLVLGDGKYRPEASKVGKVISNVENPLPYLKTTKYAFVSRYLSILEAMQSKKLVFAAYDTPIKKDYLAMTPFKSLIVICNSSEDIAKKVFFFLANKKRGEIITNKAYLFAKEQTWKKLAKKYYYLWSK